MLVEVGDLVEEGQELFQLDSTQLEWSVQRAEIALELARIALLEINEQSSEAILQLQWRVWNWRKPTWLSLKAEVRPKTKSQRRVQAQLPLGLDTMSYKPAPPRPAFSNWGPTWSEPSWP